MRAHAKAGLAQGTALQPHDAVGTRSHCAQTTKYSREESQEMVLFTEDENMDPNLLNMA